jgi:(p)ppGpp synthase/HD superfamily hydrolase
MISTLEKALQLATLKHAGQTDKAGLPYILHPVYVSLCVETEDEKIVALLHDILEDTDTTEQELLDIGISTAQLDAIKLLTKPPKESYMQYIARVANNKIARNVKKADLRHNMELERLPKITEKDVIRHTKYKNVLNYILEKEREDLNG